jgi:fructose-specific component phosphotransferase system IIB-like protein
MRTKKSLVQQMLMSILNAAILAVGLTACSDDMTLEENVNDTEMTDNQYFIGEKPDEPMNDVMYASVTANVPAAVLSSFDYNSMGAALARRMPSATASVSKDTRLILVKGSDIANHSGNMKDWASVYLKGGSIAIENPTGKNLEALANAMENQLAAAKTAQLTADGDIAIKAHGKRHDGKTYEGELLKVRVRNVKDYASAYSGVNDTENDMVAELVIFGPNSYYMYSTNSKEGDAMTDQDGNAENVNVEENQQATSYTSGLKADGAAIWLSDNAVSPMPRTHRAKSNSSGTAGINELMSCSDQFTVEGALYTRDWENSSVTRQGTFTTTYRIWGVNDHSNNANTDYYYVKQNSTLRIGGSRYTGGNTYYDTFYWGKYEPRWYFQASNFKNGDNLYYGSWLDEYKTYMDLSGDGNITVEYALPGTDNNSGSQSIAIGTSQSASLSIGGTFSASPGASLTGGWAEGSSFTMTTTTTAKELKVVKNTDGTKVTWSYQNSQKPKLYSKSGKICHSIVPDAVTNDVDVENQVCWSVKNPSGRYKINVYNLRTMAYLTKTKGDGKRWTDHASWLEDTNNYTLLKPNRAEQTWHFDVTPSTLGKEGHNGDKQKLAEALMTQFPEAFQTLTVVADRTIDSENAIQNVVAYAKQLINDKNGGRTMREYALDLGCDSYVIRWYCTTGTHNDYELTISLK